jgi:hypothetical protein
MYKVITASVHLSVFLMHLQDPSTAAANHVAHQISPVYPAVFSTPGRVLGSPSPALLRDERTGQRIYSPTDPDHPSRRPISPAFRNKYRMYYDGTFSQMPQHHVVCHFNRFVRPIVVTSYQHSGTEAFDCWNTSTVFPLLGDGFGVFPFFSIVLSTIIDLSTYVLVYLVCCVFHVSLY